MVPRKNTRNVGSAWADSNMYTYFCGHQKERKNTASKGRELLMFPRCSRIRASEFRNQPVDGLAPTFLQSRGGQLRSKTMPNGISRS
jgi:hypothetical protein